MGDQGKRPPDGSDQTKSSKRPDKKKRVEGFRAHAAQVDQWREDSTEVEKQRLTANKGTHIRFDNDGNPTVADGQEVPSVNVLAYRELHGRRVHDDTLVLPDWQNASTRQEFKAVLKRISDKVQHDNFYAAHHIISKRTLEDINAMLTDGQRKILASKLDRDVTEKNKALSNLYSNLSIGPGPDYRRGDPGDSLDATFYQVENDEPIMDPRSQQYHSIDQIMKKRRYTEGLSEKEFTDILGCLEMAEKIHVVLTEGYTISPEVSMWEKVAGTDNQWKKAPIQISRDEWERMRLNIERHAIEDKSLSELKKEFQEYISSSE